VSCSAKLEWPVSRNSVQERAGDPQNSRKNILLKMPVNPETEGWNRAGLLVKVDQERICGAGRLMKASG